MEVALHEFIQAINDAGGVVECKGNYEPVGDRDWIDLGNAYISACRAVGVTPMIVKVTEIWDETKDEGTASDRGTAPGVERES